MLAGLGVASAGAAMLEPGASRDYVFVFIKTGPTTDLTDTERQEAFAGHFSNMKRMAAAGELLIAGPFGEPLAAPDHRGLFVIDAPSLDKGMAIAHTDPTTGLGVFVLEGFVFTTDRPLTELPRLEREAEAARLADPDATDEWAGRMYFLATAPYADERLNELSETQGVLIAGRLHGSGPDADGDGSPDDQVLAWLDATDAEIARATSHAGGDGDDEDDQPWTLHGWYGSAEVEMMAD
ncbi:MAG: hypothetical protein ACI89L_001881 [Phycisphaerales bacterium]|jgi:uncharacterized protein YciI